MTKGQPTQTFWVCCGCPVPVGSANLGGGHLVDLPEGLIPNDIVWSDTYFSEEKFNKLGTRDKQYAYLKQNRPDDWRRIVEVSLEVAYSQLA